MTTQVVALVAGFFAWLIPVFADAPIVVRNVFEDVKPSRAVLLFGGDMMFDRAIRIAMIENGDDHVFSCIAEVLQSADFVVANLEGPITPYASKSIGSTVGSPENFTFTFTTSTASLLKRHNISLVNLGNNHILNFGQDGVTQTKKWLEAAGVSYFGDPQGEASDRVARLDVKGIPFSFINWSDWTGGTKEEVVAQISAERAAGRMPIVYTHWGDEYVAPSERMEALAHAFIDAGAEIVIGSHPHVVLEHEIYPPRLASGEAGNGKYIYYSLGNLVFDQYFNEEVRSGLMLKIVFDKSGVDSITPIATYLERDRRTCLK